MSITFNPTHLLRRQFIATGISLVAGGLLAACSDEKPVPIFHGVDLTGAKYAKEFSLVDHNGKLRQLTDFKGKLVMLFFGFTQCPDVCPTSLARAVEIKGLLGADGDRLQVLFMTIDPERDTATVLKAYMNAFDPSFLGLLANMQDTQKTADAFKVYYKKIPAGSSYTMDHSALTYVYDPAGHLRLAFRHEDSAKNCAEDLRNLLKST